jgi:phosphoribosylaminoimidazole-succinocarboxamide synthase
MNAGLFESSLRSLPLVYRGKVRDSYAVAGDKLLLITTDRLSAFDHVLTTLPFKGDLLNTLAHFWFQKTAHVVKNHVIDLPDPCVTVARRAEPFAIEFVVRAYLTGSLWRDYEAGRDPYGLHLPAGLKRDSKFPAPILTPSTKAPIGQHDEPLSEAQVIERGLVSARDWQRAKEAALGLFAVGTSQAATQGLLFVDTKYEFGRIADELVAWTDAQKTIGGKVAHLVFVIDEMGTFIGDSTDRISELNSLAEMIGNKGKGKVWLVLERVERRAAHGAG